MRLRTARACLVAGLAVLVPALHGPAAAADSCRFPNGGAAGGTLGSDGQIWLYRFEPRQIRIGEPFAVELLACDPAAELLSVDAVMPAHRHGMNYIPRLVRTQPARWRAERMLFHMPGLWRLHLSWRGPQGRADARVDVSVK